MRMQSRPLEIFRLADRFWRKILVMILYLEDLATAKPVNKPG